MQSGSNTSTDSRPTPTPAWPRRGRAAAALALAAAAVLIGCATQVDKPFVATRTSELPPMKFPADNPSTPAKVELGKLLFADPRLSGTGKMACQGCHYRPLGWTDNKVLSRKDDGTMNTRHTPSLYNVGYQTAWYWDGRATTLEAQVLAAWRGQIGGDPAKVAEALNAVPGYRTRFEAVWRGPATPDNVVKSLATFFRSLVSTDSAWDLYEKGDALAVDRAAIDGFELFTGKGRCATCHTPPYYGNSTFFNVGLEHAKDKPDAGRMAVTKNEADRGAFKTPSLRSVALGAPYMHDGSVATLKEAVAMMAAGGKPGDPAKSPLMVPTGLTPAEVDKIVAFLNTLTSTEPWEQPTLP